MSPILRCALSAATLLVSGTALAHTNQSGIDPRNFDSNTGACSDFFQHANGGWLAANPIPAQYSQWSLDDELRERNLELLRGILEDAAKNPGASGSTTQKIGDFYASAIDEPAIEAAGYSPIKAELARIDAIKTGAEVAALVRDWHTQGLPVLFRLEVESDMKNPDLVIAYAMQGGLGLPDRDYYLRKDAKATTLLGQYRAHVARMLGLIGVGDPARQAEWVVDLETQLAKASLDLVALREPLNLYHMVDVHAADTQNPHLDWSALFAALGRKDINRFSLSQPAFFAAADNALAKVPVTHWQAYLRWHLVDAVANDLSTAFVNANFDFRGRTLRGVQELKPRWKRAIDATNRALGFALGEAYVQRRFPPQAKQRAVVLVENLQTALRARLQKLDWMSDATRQAALAKLATFTPKIGYPDKWRDYSALTIKRESYFDNVHAANAFEKRRQIARIGKPLDRSEWMMLPQTVNAYYNPLQNEVVFPAAQMQPPYFDANADDAVNYGAIGAVIGHELLHGFDDQGSRFDAKGNLSDWWTADDRKRFEARTARLVKQFDAYVPIDELHINGKLTLGENIADLGGLLVAWDAFGLTAQAKGSEKIDGLSPAQRFFLSFAQSWRTQQRPEALRLQVQSNEHAPAKYRVNGPVSNLPQFSTAFGCRNGQPMARPANVRVDIW
ncbi:M13 family metallopeptidase [Dokdonella sp.]|uniref:M13 family metallopeptidase n=1 Tax=Dokdonella sp. TaxID=2291710 RepID=UPI0025BFC7A4|nr:M13 family metallopeptidase [Dokdonella sp.]MBX3689048.1 M13 family metallopeptidase [Dokdonella sp.]